MQSKQNLTRARWIAYPAVIVVLGLALWLTSPLSFYLLFQRRVLAIGDGSRTTPLLTEVPGPLPEIDRGTGGGDESPGTAEAGNWQEVGLGDLVLVLPPGEIRKTALEGKVLVVEYARGKILASRHGPGLLRATFARAWEVSGGSLDDLPGHISGGREAELLYRAARATINDYRFLMSNRERTLYASDILAKLYLWDPNLVERGALLERGDRKGVLMRGPDQRAVVLLVWQESVVIFTIEDYPLERLETSEWVRFLDVRPAGE